MKKLTAAAIAVLLLTGCSTPTASDECINEAVKATGVTHLVNLEPETLTAIVKGCKAAPEDHKYECNAPEGYTCIILGDGPVPE